MEISKKVAYLKGLLEGLSLDESKPETRVLHMMADILEVCADEIDALNVEAERVDDYLDELDHDLGDLESVVFDTEGDDEEDDDEYDFDDEDFFGDEDDEDEALCTGECDDCNMCGGPDGEDEQ